MSFQNAAPYFLIFVAVINPYSFSNSKFLIKILVCLLIILHFVVSTITHGNNVIESPDLCMEKYSATGANYCLGAY